MIYNKFNIVTFHMGHKIISSITLIKSSTEHILSYKDHDFEQIVINLTPVVKFLETEPGINRTIKELILDNLL